ncbi:Urocanate hydratase, partial [Araneus ventricosus]
LAFNQAIKNGLLQGPIVLSRDHHDVSGTDSPFRETSNISDGSAFCADMAVQNCIGDSFRGATWVALHNGGGVGWGEVMNGGFGLLLDGSEEAECRARQVLHWDVLNGVARRSWSGNNNAADVINQAMRDEPRLEVTVPHEVLDDFTPVVTKVLAAVRTLDRFGISDRAGAVIVSAALQDVGIVSESNVLKVVDKNKILRGRAKARTTLLSQVIKDYDHDQFGLYFDERKDMTLSMEDNR